MVAQAVDEVDEDDEGVKYSIKVVWLPSQKSGRAVCAPEWFEGWPDARGAYPGLEFVEYSKVKSEVVRMFGRISGGGSPLSQPTSKYPPGAA